MNKTNSKETSVDIRNLKDLIEYRDSLEEALEELGSLSLGGMEEELEELTKVYRIGDTLKIEVDDQDSIGGIDVYQVSNIISDVIKEKARVEDLIDKKAYEDKGSLSKSISYYQALIDEYQYKIEVFYSYLSERKDGKELIMDVEYGIDKYGESIIIERPVEVTRKLKYDKAKLREMERQDKEILEEAKNKLGEIVRSIEVDDKFSFKKTDSFMDIIDYYRE